MTTKITKHEFLEALYDQGWIMYSDHSVWAPNKSLHIYVMDEGVTLNQNRHGKFLCYTQQNIDILLKLSNINQELTDLYGKFEFTEGK